MTGAQKQIIIDDIITATCCTSSAYQAGLAALASDADEHRNFWLDKVDQALDKAEKTLSGLNELVDAFSKD